MTTTASLEERQRRIAHNQAMFREVNERLDELIETFKHTGEETSFVCECANTDCTEHVAMDASRYDRMRAHPTPFVVAPAESHVFPEAERVIERTESFWIVEKVEKAGEEAARLDPRQDDQ